LQYFKKNLLILLIFIALFNLNAEDKTTTSKIKTECLPILVDDRARTNYPFGVQGQTPDLIILGSSSFEKKVSRNKTFKIEVDEIFYGWTDKKVLDVSYPWRIQNAKWIMALVHAKYPKSAGATWQHKYSIPGTPVNIAGAKALGKARLAFYTLTNTSFKAKNFPLTNTMNLYVI
jgi:hypothetical protein